MQNGEAKLGQVVLLEGNDRRFLITGVKRAESMEYHHDFIELSGLSGEIFGCRPGSVSPDRLVLDADQTIVFNGDHAYRLQYLAQKNLSGHGVLTASEEGADAIVGGRLDTWVKAIDSAEVKS